MLDVVIPFQLLRCGRHAQHRTNLLSYKTFEVRNTPSKSDEAINRQENKTENHKMLNLYF